MMLFIFLLTFLRIVPGIQGQWQVVREEFPVAGTPVPGTCTLKPDEEPATGYNTTHVFTCDGWTDPQDGRLVYSLVYFAPGEETDPLHFLYRGLRPSASNLVLPSGEHSYKAIVENEEHLETSFDLGKQSPSPFSFQLPGLQEEIDLLPMRIQRGDSHRALMRADLLALAALEQFESKDLQSLRNDVLDVLEKSPLYSRELLQENLRALITITGKGLTPPSSDIKQNSTRQLLHLIEQHDKTVKDSQTEIKLQDDGHDYLVALARVFPVPNDTASNEQDSSTGELGDLIDRTLESLMNLMSV